MPIKKNKLSEVKYALGTANNRLEDTTKIADLPEFAIKKIQELQAELKKIDISQYQTSSIMLTGHVATQEDVFSILKEESGYTEWNLINPFEKYDDYEFHAASFKSYYGVEYNEQEVKEYMFRRDTNSRDVIRSITVTVFPEHFSVLFDTSRVTAGSNGILTLEEFKNYIRSIFL